MPDACPGHIQYNAAKVIARLTDDCLRDGHLQVLEPDALIKASVAEAAAFAATGHAAAAEVPEMVQLGQQAKTAAEVSCFPDAPPSFVCFFRNTGTPNIYIYLF